MTKKIVITSEFFGKFSDEGEKILLDAGFEVIENPYKKLLDEDEVISIIGEADGIICDLEGITKKVIDGAPNLKIISRRGVGTDSVDVEYAKEKEIVVSRTLGVVEKPVAELVMSYILNINRKISELNKEMKMGNWTKLLGNSLEGKVLGIMGMGNIGREVARKAKAFDMKIIYTDARRNEKAEEELGVEFVSFEELMAGSDAISIHVPLLESTRGKINYEAMKAMKKKPILINTARGPVINEADLCKALEEGMVSFAAIDVYDVEPKTDSPLKEYDNVILTPHVGTFTEEVFINMDILAAKNIVDHFR
ncbi:phosphoglycerate dehydrogenase [Maledivibacter halophilus]|uniref:D-3-phosphoglycerate dehydrogenase n=1 Tax=Maledivibacter halophilus TaxID=36842 RepID=A0A1T5KRZ7_9FIRM|nr:phosphoglycerate dehydrogenase [Maledivibacter halophilus]SKC66169.1 D-3-phosphoglycerate dehydrogenase [Maledivibacter halophilus]